jgi:Major Facilitator Superfamily
MSSETGSDNTPQAEEHDAYAAWRHRNFRLFVCGFVLIWMAGQLVSIAVEWEIYLRTGSALALGWIGLVQALPVIALALPAGHLADRFNRRTIVLIGMAVTTLTSTGLMLVSWFELPAVWIYTLILAEAIARAVGWPARSALLPQLIPTKDFSNAVTWNSSFIQVSSVVGPAVGGMLVAWSVSFTFGLAAALRLVSMALLFGLTIQYAARTAGSMNVRNLVAGIRFVWRTKLILATITLDLFAVLFGGAVYLLPIYAKDILNVGAVGFGFLRAAPAIGAVVMALYLAHRRPMQRPGWALIWAVIGFGAATIVFGVSRWFVLSLAMLAVTGALDNISVVVRHTLVQVLTPDSMRGRVSAVNNVFISSSNDLGGMESGITAHWWGPAASVVVGGVATILVVVGVAAVWPQIRRIKALHLLEPVAEDQAATVSRVE